MKRGLILACSLAFVLMAARVPDRQGPVISTSVDYCQGCAETGYCYPCCRCYGGTPQQCSWCD
jgi:hypothetical protein